MSPLILVVRGWAIRCCFAGLCEQTGPSQRPFSQWTYRKARSTWTPQTRKYIIETMWPVLWFKLAAVSNVVAISDPLVEHSGSLCYPRFWALWRTWLAKQGAGQMRSQQDTPGRLNTTRHKWNQTFDHTFGLPVLIWTKKRRLVDSLIIFVKFYYLIFSFMYDIFIALLSRLCHVPFVSPKLDCSRL